MSERHFSLSELAKSFGQIQTWTPEIWDSSYSGAESQTYGPDNAGSYVRLGNIVFITGRLDITSIGTLTTTETARLGNLPYNVATESALHIGYAAGVSITAGVSLHGNFAIGTKSVALRMFNLTSGTGPVLISNITGTGDLVFSGFYITNDAV